MHACTHAHMHTQVICEGIGEKVRKEPGFMLHGRPVVGKAIVVQGV